MQTQFFPLFFHAAGRRAIICGTFKFLPSSTSLGRSRRCVSTTAASSSLLYCRERVQQHDRDGFQTSIFFTPSATREFQWILRAFNLELASVRDAVRQDTLGLMRLEWWHSAIRACFTKDQPLPDHPVLVALSHYLASAQPKPSRMWFNKLISSRKENMSMKQYTTMEDLERYTEDAFSSLLYLQLESLDLRLPALDHLASHLGKCIGLTSFLRAVPMQALQQGRFYLPAELAARHRLSAEDVHRVMRHRLASATTGKGGKPAPPSLVGGEARLQELQESLQHVVYDVSSVAHQHLQVACEHIQAMRRDVRTKAAVEKAWPVWLQVVPSSRYLQKLEQHQFDVLHPTLVQTADWKLPLVLWWKYKRFQL